MEHVTSDPEQARKKARDILDGMSERRLIPSIIKFTETRPRAQGGQGVVVIGTIPIPETVREYLPEKVVPWLPKELILPLPAWFDVRKSEVKVAVKKLYWDREDAEVSTRFFKSFVNELSLMREVSHPNIIHFIGFVEDIEKGDAWIISPWEENGNVREFLASGEWDIPERVSLIQDVISGVEYLHTRQPSICHGDLKSLNILVNSLYQAVITDFGLSRIKQSANQAGDRQARLAEPEVVGNHVAPEPAFPKAEFNSSTCQLTLTAPGFSLRWTAPEVLDNGVQDFPSDMWALGWICWEITTGRLPFDELKTEGAIIMKTVKGELPPIRENAQLSHVLQLCSIMSDCWIPNPASRIDASAVRQKIRFVPSKTPSERSCDSPMIRSAALLVELGTMYRMQRNTTAAESHYQSAISVADVTKDNATKANALNGLGNVYRAESKYGEAEKAFQDAQEIHSGLGNYLGAANSLFGLGNLYRMNSNYHKAEEVLRKAYEMYSNIANHVGAANASDVLGQIYLIRSDYLKAKKAFQEAYDTYARIGNDLGMANTLHGIGETHYAQTNLGEAERCIRSACDIFSRIGNDEGEANTQHGLGQIYRNQSRNQEAEKAFIRAYDIHRRSHNKLGMANALNGLGNTYHAQSKREEAKKAFEEANEIHSQIGNDVGKANALDGLGEIYLAQSMDQEAETFFKKAYETHSRMDNHMGMANALDGLGKVYHAQSKYQEAEKAFREACGIYSRIGNNQGVGNSFRHLGALYHVQNRYQEAEASHRQAVAAYDRAGDGAGKGKMLLALAINLHDQGKENGIVEAFGQARAAFGAIADDEGELMALDGLMIACYHQRRFIELQSFCADARKICSGTGRAMSGACITVWELIQAMENSVSSPSAGV